MSHVVPCSPHGKAQAIDSYEFSGEAKKQAM